MKARSDRKLSDADVSAIRAASDSYRACGAVFGVSPAVIRKVRLGLTYKTPEAI